MTKQNKLPFIRWYASDFLAGTRGMKAAEVGIYTILLNLMYEQCKPLPLDIDYLSSQCGCRKAAFNKVLEKLKIRDKIIIKNGGLWNERVEKEFNFRAKKSSIATHNALKRWEKPNEINSNSMQTQCNGNANAMLNQKPYTRNQKPIEKIYKKEFDEFYNLYPRKIGKRAASLKYDVIKLEVKHEDLIEAVKAFAESVKDKEKKFIPHPATWLNQGRWDDEFEEPEFNAAAYVRQLCKEDEENENI